MSDPTRSEMREAADELLGISNDFHILIRRLQRAAKIHSCIYDNCIEAVEQLRTTKKSEIAAVMRVLKDKMHE